MAETTWPEEEIMSMLFGDKALQVVDKNSYAGAMAFLSDEISSRVSTRTLRNTQIMVASISDYRQMEKYIFFVAIDQTDDTPVPGIPIVKVPRQNLTEDDMHHIDKDMGVACAEKYEEFSIVLDEDENDDGDGEASGKLRSKSD